MKKIYLIIFLLFMSAAVKSQQVEKVTAINYYGFNGLNPTNLTVFNGKLYFFGTNDQQYVNKLMFTDGTAAGVTVVKQIDSVKQYPSLIDLTVLNSLLIFRNYHQLWKSDGTTGGTTMIKNISAPNFAPRSVVLNSKVYFDGDITNSFPVKDQLLETDGTGNGTKLVKAINPTGAAHIANMSVYGDKLYFSAHDGTGSSSSNAPWVSDGTAAGTIKLKDIVALYGSNSREFTLYNGKVYFNATDNASGSQLWVTDGTPAGTLKVTNINPTGNGLNPSSFILFNSKLFFMGIDKGAFFQLWSTDGTEAGTKLVKTDYTLRTYSGFLPNSMAVMNNKLYMSGYDSLTKTSQLWVSDGTKAGTTKVTNFAHGLSPARLYSFQNKLIMTGNDTITHAVELFVSDGTAAGTICPKPPSTGVDAFYPWQAWVPFNNSLYYRAAYGLFSDYQLCRYFETIHPGIPELTNQNLPVYPNPTNGFFTVTLPPSILKADIDVYNSTGTLISKQTASNAVNTVDLSIQTPGLYFLKVICNNRVIDSQKIIKQ
jgi:ELWxxDGT repeat protein